MRSYKLSPAVVPLMEEKTKTEQDETGGVAVSAHNIASKKTANSKQGEAKRILKLADTMHLQLEATIADSRAQMRRITCLSALD